MNSKISEILKQELFVRQKQNRKYSLRAFARDMGLSPSFLSEVLKGRKMLSVDKALTISKTLGHSWRESQLFLQSAQLAQAKSGPSKKFLKREIKQTESQYGRFQPLKLGRFSVVSNWYYMAILELTALPGFSDDPRFVAKKLRIRIEEATIALQQLKRAGLIVLDEKGTWKKSIDVFVSDHPSADIRKFHRQHLMNANEAIENQDFHQRHFSGLTMAINPQKIPEAIRLIKEFRSRMSALLETGEKEKVYHLAVQLFQLDDSGVSHV